MHKPRQIARLLRQLGMPANIELIRMCRLEEAAGQL